MAAGEGIRHADVGTDLTQTEFEQDASHEIYQDIDFGGYGYTSFNPVIENHTADDTLTIAESGSIHTNLGAAATITLTLPQDAANGCTFKFIVLTDYQLRIDPGAAGAIYINGAKQTDDKYIYLYIDSNIELVCDSNHDWFTVYVNGTYGIEE